MPETIDNYAPVKTRPFRRQALKVWAWSAGIAAAWVLLIVLPALFGVAGHAALGEPIFSFFGWACHQMPERSLFLGGHQLAVCTRCFGVYFGLVAAVAVYPLWRRVDEIEPLPRIWLFLSILPIGIDWSLTVFGLWENTHLTRFVTGAVLGAACATYIIPALVEIVRFARRSRAA